MTHDSPDWATANASGNVYPVQDMGELAARLGSIVTHDRRGDVFFLDDFEAGLGKWSPTLSGTGALAELTITRSRSGMFAAHLLAGSDASESAGISHYAPLPSAQKLGAALGVAILSPVLYVNLDFYVYEGVNSDRYHMRYLPGTTTLQVLNSGGTYTDVTASLNLQQTATLFHSFKLVLDPATGYYERAIVNATEYDLTGIQADSSPRSAPDSVRLYAWIQDQSGNAGDVYVDDVVLTHNEPAVQ